MAGNSVEIQAAAMARQLVECLAERHCMLVIAESCTAGLVSDLVARVSGASAVLWGSFVCYTPEAKQRMLGIDADFLRRHGLVSGETVRKMAICALNLADASIAAAVTGIAGPLGDGSNTPIGTVWVAVAHRTEGKAAAVSEKELHFDGSRAEIRMQAAAAVLEELLKSTG